MELASVLAGEPFSDRPQSVCPVVGAYLRSLNDLCDDRRRQALLPYAAAAVGTRGGEHLERLRLERCRRELRDIRPRRRSLRLLDGPKAALAPGSVLALEQFAVHLLRAMRRTDEDWHARAMALADELIAMAIDRSPRDDRVVSERGLEQEAGMNA